MQSFHTQNHAVKNMLKDKILNRIILDTMKKRGRAALAELDRNCEQAVKRSEDLLLQLIADNQDTEYGKKYHFDEIHSIEDYKKNVPFSSYDDYAPYIERMIKKNEEGLISVSPAVQQSSLQPHRS